jgi:hypothetical protein
LSIPVYPFAFHPVILGPRASSDHFRLILSNPFCHPSDSASVVHYISQLIA